MANKKEIHNFAVRYYNLYFSLQTDEREVKEGFGEQCLALGFKMDCGKRFIKTFSNDALYKNEYLEKIINSIDDVDLLGSAIFSHWRYVTHWGYADYLLDKANRPWFITAFKRLIELTEDKHTQRFNGTLRKIQLASNNICFGPRPDPNDEVEQHLTITADGRVWLSRYRFGSNDFEHHEFIEKRSFTISDEAVEKIINGVSDFFKDEYVEYWATDIGFWSLVLTNTKGKSFKVKGSLCCSPYLNLGYLSDLIRTELVRDDLFVFDGNPDGVQE